MISVLNDLKLKYKNPDTPKTFLVALRDAGVVLSNEDILTESIEISESICSASSFKVGLCESSVAKVTVNYPSNADGDEMTIVQIMGDADLTFTYPQDWTKAAMQISGDCITPSSFSSSSFFDPLKYYFLSVYVEYIGKAVYLYGEEANGITKMIYYLNPGLYGFTNLRDWDDQETYDLEEIVLHNDRVWQSRTNENTVEPASGVNAWRNVTKRMHILIPIIGYDFQSVKMQFYVPDGEDDDYAEVYMNLYEIAFPVMPLGIYGIKSSKKRNDLPLREFLGYDRMQDARLGADVNYNFESATAVVGDLLNEAAEGTAVVIGTNLSKADGSVEVIDGSIVTEAVPNYPTGVMYTVDNVEEGTVVGQFWSVEAYPYELDRPISYWKDHYHLRFDYDEATQVITTRGVYHCDYYYDYVSERWMYNHYFTRTDVSTLNPNPNYYNDMEVVASVHYGPIKSIYSTNPFPSTTCDYDSVKFHKVIAYDFQFNIPERYISENWDLVSEDINPVTPTRPTATCTRLYRKVHFSGSWSEAVVGTRVRYRILNYNPYDPVTNPTGIIYEAVAYNPFDVGVAPFEEYTIYGDLVQRHVDDGGTPGANNVANHQAAMEAIYNYSTHGVITPDANGEFEISYVSLLTYSGNDSGSCIGQNPFRGVQVHSTQERFNAYEIGVTDTALHTTKRHVITSYLELNGFFIRFNRYGISTFLSVAASSLYPAENIFPKDPSGNYGAIYPMEGPMEVLASSYCRSIEIDDDINPPFDGVRISSTAQNGYIDGAQVKSFPFYYNRLDRKYGAIPAGMQQTGYWESNNYYEISGNFYFDYFTFTKEQLIAICETIMERIGDMQYFNLLTEIQALPYMEPGDGINIMTPQNGYVTAILRRTMSGCIDQKDTIETDFY